MRKFSLFLAAGALAAVSTTAMAADIRPMPQQVPSYTPPKQVSVFNWTGFQVGASASYNWKDADAQTGLIFGPFSLAGNGDGSGAGFGLDLTALYQPTHSNWVYGLSLGGNWLDVAGSSPIALQGPGGGAIPGTSYSHKLKDFWTGTAALGYARDRWLVYVDGGVAHGKGTAIASAGGFSTSASARHVGWTVGVGVDWAFYENWVAGLKYSYVDLGRADYSFPLGGPSITARTDADLHTLKFRIARKFGS